MRTQFQLPRDFQDFFSCLTREKCEFVVVGAYAMAAWGYIRATGDLDVFVNPTRENASKVFTALKRYGTPLRGIAEEDFASVGTVFQIGVPPLRIDILTHIDGVDFHKLRGHIVNTKAFGITLPVLSVHKLIANKGATGRARDKADVEELRKITRGKRK